MSECIQCHGSGYMTVRDKGQESIEPCTHCRVGSARWWERKQRATEERKKRRKLVDFDQFGGGHAD
jgi:hypothetical protein